MIVMIEMVINSVVLVLLFYNLVQIIIIIRVAEFVDVGLNLEANAD